MRECDNSKIHITSNFILSICPLIMFITLQHLATLDHTIPNYTSLHLSTLHLLSYVGGIIQFNERFDDEPTFMARANMCNEI